MREEFYRLPEVGGVYTTDVLVFNLDDGTDPTKLGDKKEWFLVGVFMAAMLRLPDAEGRGDEKRYTFEADRDPVLNKMRAVMRILGEKKGVDQVVFAALGCSAYGNPVGEIARAWRRAFLVRVDKEGASTDRRRRKSGPGENKRWRRMDVVFAIKDDKMAMAFERAFGPDLLEQGIPYPHEGDETCD